MLTSRIDKVLELSLETQALILSDTTTTSSILRRCLTICKMLNREDENKWIRDELNGYGREHITFGELDKIVPEYRKVIVMYLDQYNRPIIIDNEKLAKLFQHHPIGEPISELEESVTEGLYIYGQHCALLRKDFNIPAMCCHVPAISIRRIVESVKNRALEFVNQIVVELQFGGILSDIFEKTRQFVDTKLSSICPEVLQNLVHTYKAFLASKASHDWKKIAFACRDILQDFTDSIYSPAFLPIGEMAPTREQTKNKVRYALMAKLGSSKGEERKLVEVQIDYFDRLTDYINKHVHRQSSEEAANRCVIYTYLIIGDILKLLET